MECIQVHNAPDQYRNKYSPVTEEDYSVSSIQQLGTGESETKSFKFDQLPQVISLNVGGQIYTTSRATLCGYPGSMFETMLNTQLPTRMTGQHIFIDRDPKHFSKILNFLRDGHIPLPPDIQQMDEIKQEARFFQLPSLVSFIEQKSHTKAQQLRSAVKLATLEGIEDQLQQAMDTILELAYGPPYSQKHPLYLSEQELWLKKPENSRSIRHPVVDGSIEYVYIKRISDGTFMTKNSCDPDFQKYDLFRFLVQYHALVIDRMTAHGFSVKMSHPSLHCSACHASSVRMHGSGTCQCIFVVKVHLQGGGKGGK